ncbi:MAG TPA: hypothetical protein VEK07_17255 [Polyangiaceae bacterium]|nr:hypothetical protein [Polyangiaceae bacterium]
MTQDEDALAAVLCDVHELGRMAFAFTRDVRRMWSGHRWPRGAAAACAMEAFGL